MPSPLDFDKFAALLWYMSSAPIDKLRAGTLRPAADFPEFGQLVNAEQDVFALVDAKMPGLADDLEVAQEFFKKVFADTQLWTTDHFLVPQQIVDVMRLAPEQALRQTQEAKRTEYDSGA